MRIKRVECDQFAGLTGKDIELDNGLNIIIGENESGKSTLVDLVYQLLFKDVKLDGRSDSDFIDRYFPKKVSGPQGDVIDGVIVFETPSGTYKLKKEWERGEGTCRLTLPDGTSVKNNATIKEILLEELKHRAGVYSEIVFASQKREQMAVESIMRALGKKSDSLSETRADLASTLTQAALETGGVSLEKLDKIISNNMSELIGRWDRTADAPEGGAKRATYKNAWSNGAGSIVKAYYEVDEIRTKQADVESAERAVEEINAKIMACEARKRKAEEDRITFQKYRGMLGQHSLLTGVIKDQDTKINEQSEVLLAWPGLINNLTKSCELKKLQKHAQVHELFLRVQSARQLYLNKKSELDKLKEVDDSDLKNLRDMISCKQKEESKLTGMNLVAKISKLGSADINVTSSTSGKELALNEGEVQITEAVDINIPGIADIQLAPGGVDVDAVKQTVKTLGTEIKKLYDKYEVNSPEELQAKSDDYDEIKRETEKYRTDFETMLGDNDWESLKAANDTVPPEITTEAEIKTQIEELCGTKPIDAFIGGLESTLTDYKTKYESVEKLEESIEKLKTEKDKNKKKLDSMDEIPEEFQGIDDPEQYDAGLQGEIEKYKGEIKTQRDKLIEAARNLGDKSAEEYSDELQDKEAVLAAKKKEYEHWQNIYDAFCRLKEKTGGNPVEDIEQKFKEYLQVITDGNLDLNSMDEQLSVQLASGSSALTYDILSDGTKDTISLAFRLAMLEHLYPEGNGLAVFDDPFTDMDAKRVEQSCKLIQKFAENNQVIFVTCDAKYKDIMSGTVIPITR